MLKTLDIENVALIDKLSIDFSSKFTVLSGETGAGKSIIIDSLGFVLGGKASKTLLKQGQNFMKVVATFSAPFSSDVKNVLNEYGIDFDDELIFSRKMTADGKGDIRVNGTSVTLLMLKNISTLIVDIHGQHEHQRLLKDKFHLQIIDGFVKDKSIFCDYQSSLEQLKSLNSRIQELNFSFENQERMLDLLDYQIKEIENAELKPDEDETLEKKKLAMKNYEKIFDGLSSATDVLDGNFSVVDALKNASSSVANLTNFDESLQSIADRLESAKYEILDITDTLEQKKKETNFDEHEFEEVDERLDKIKLLKKKYGPSILEIFAFLEKSKKEYDDILNSREELKLKLQEKSNLLNKIFSDAQKISLARREIAKNFEEKTKKELDDLGMKNAKFIVQFNSIDKNNFENNLTSTGFDDVRFMFSANAGQDVQPLSEIISGGEASRFMLAIKNILAEFDNIMLMVFDEIDTGISGEMGFKVACKLANISRKHQVVCVSHLPQICAMADHNVRVEKLVKNEQTFVNAQTLSSAQALEEISRLSGGSQNSTVSLNHATALKQRCNDYKNSL